MKQGQILTTLLMLGFLFFGFQITELSANTTHTEPTIQYFDENNQPIFPYSQDILKEYQNVNNQISNWNIYYLSKTKFTYQIWVASGRYFRNPGTVILNANNTVRSAITIKAYDGSKLAGSASLSSGWIGSISVPFSHLPRGKSYRFQLQNNTHNSTVNLT